MSLLLRAWTRVPRPAAYLLTVGALAGLYFAAARFGLRYASIGQSVSLVWPPTGLAFAALVALGYRYWPGVAIGAFLANAATPVPLAAAAGIAVGNTLEALLAASLLRRAAGTRPRLESMATIRALVAAALVGAIISAIVGVSTLTVTGVLAEPRAVSTVAVWWTGDVLGALVVAPFLFAWLLNSRPRKETRGVLEIILLCLGTATAAELGLTRYVGPMLHQVDYLYLLFPFVIWAALRFGARGASLMTLTISAVAVWHTTQGTGPFIAATAPGTLLAATCYLAAVAVTGLTLAAAVAHERQTATSALEQREQQLRVALDAARMGIWSWSTADNRLIWDDTLRRLYGLTPAEEVGGYNDFLSRVHPEDREFVHGRVRHALEEGGSLDYEFRIILPDGSVRWIADQGRVVLGEGRKPLGMTGVCMDVTQRRATDEQLRQAHRMESIGRLAGGVAHEANNQMSVVIGATDFILRRLDVPPAVRSDVESVRRAAERTAAVTAQLLAFSRRQVLKPQVLDLNALLQRFHPVLRRMMGEDCSVTLRPGEGIGRLKADPGQLEQVLINLALNARDAMPQGGELIIETLSVELSRGTAPIIQGVAVRPGSYAVLAVSDTGHGMDQSVMIHIFDPFFTTKDVGQGTGLGLSTVYGIVKQSDGYIWAYSEPGRGATFKIYLPTTSESPAVLARPSGGVPVRASGELILVVEDEEAVRHTAARGLAESGYRVLQADSGHQALDLAAQSPDRIALVLTDVVMPGMSGRDLAAAIGELIPGIPVLFTSGYTDGEIVRRGLLAPGAAFLPKPFTVAALVRAVRERMDAVESARL
jgi:two-component system cell cycle sensor histidine kinase/response regulator CckA